MVTHQLKVERATESFPAKTDVIATVPATNRTELSHVVSNTGHSISGFSRIHCCPVYNRPTTKNTAFSGTNLNKLRKNKCWLVHNERRKTQDRSDWRGPVGGQKLNEEKATRNTHFSVSSSCPVPRLRYLVAKEWRNCPCSRHCITAVSSWIKH